MEAPDKKEWRKDWDDHEVKELLQLAVEYRSRGAIDDRAAWRAAEETYIPQTSPWLRKAQRSG